MQLPLEDVDHFFRILRPLMFFANRRLKVLGRAVATPQEQAALSPEERFRVHQALYDHPDLIEEFADENPSDLPAEDLEIVRSWKHFVRGQFYAFRYLRNYAVFLTTTEPILAYGVVALFTPFEETIGLDLPRMLETTLLPFRGRIVYDGLLSGHRIHFGGGIRRSLDESYREAKARGIITSLAASGPGIPLVAPTTGPPKKRPAKGKPKAPATDPALDRVVALLEAFCREHLDEEYEELCVLMARELAGMRPSPLSSGKPESWAAGIARVVASINFLDDPSQPNHMRLSDIGGHLGVSDATASAKATAARKALDVEPRFDPRWTVTSQLINNPFVWMLELKNGMIVDVRHVPRAAQEDAFRKGLIPFIPADYKEPD